MRRIRKKIVHDEQMRPVAVQIDYDDWVEIEKYLDGLSLQESSQGPGQGRKPFAELAKAVKGVWTRGDGLEYQKKIRGEWDDRP